jgi:hypothetical protein
MLSYAGTTQIRFKECFSAARPGGTSSGADYDLSLLLTNQATGGDVAVAIAMTNNNARWKRPTFMFQYFERHDSAHLQRYSTARKA